MLLPNLFKTSVLLAFLSTATCSDTKYNVKGLVSSIEEQDHPSVTMDRFHRLMNPFMAWKERHGKAYDSIEHEIERMLVWMEHDGKIDEEYMT